MSIFLEIARDFFTSSEPGTPPDPDGLVGAGPVAPARGEPPEPPASPPRIRLASGVRRVPSRSRRKGDESPLSRPAREWAEGRRGPAGRHGEIARHDRFVMMKGTQVMSYAIHRHQRNFQRNPDSGSHNPKTRRTNPAAGPSEVETRRTNPAAAPSDRQNTQNEPSLLSGMRVAGCEGRQRTRKRAERTQHGKRIRLNQTIRKFGPYIPS